MNVFTGRKDTQMKKAVLFLLITLLTSCASLCALADVDPTVTANLSFYELDVIQNVDSREKLNSLRTSTGKAWFKVTPIRDNAVISIGGNSFGFSDIFNALGEECVPVFELGNAQMGKALADHMAANGITRKVIAVSKFPDALKALPQNVERWMNAESIAYLEDFMQYGVTAAIVSSADEYIALAKTDAFSALYIYSTSYSASNSIYLTTQSDSTIEYRLTGFVFPKIEVAPTPLTQEPTQALTAAPTEAPTEAPTSPTLPYSFFGLEWYIAPVTGAIVGFSILVAIFFRKRRS